MRAGFSERTFEFCFNSEFCNVFGGLLASHPNIPSQRLEKDLGYDVQFEISTGNFTGSIFLQHKIASFAEYRVGTNAHFFDAHQGAYFRFPIDNAQHNVLHTLSLTKGNAFYCAPMFHKRTELGAHFFNHSLGDNSVLLDPAEVGEIQDAGKHNISYSQQMGGMLHSDERRFKEVSRGGRLTSPEFRRGKIDEEYVLKLRQELIERTPARRRRRALPEDQFESRNPTEQVQLILARVYDVSWILLE